MQESYDVTASLFSAKAREGMIAFAGFESPEAEGMREGLLKIASFTRPDGNGYLTLTFILDLEDAPNRTAPWRDRFRRADQEALASRLGSDFEMLLDVPLNSLAGSAPFHVEEFNLYFRRLAGNQRRRLEDAVIPALSELLGFIFEPLQWVDETRAPNPNPESVQSETNPHQSLKRRLGHG